MEKIICASCGATLVPDPTQPVLVCEYCDTAMPNTYYVEGSAPAATPDLPQICVTTLVQMGQDENLTKVKGDCFGNPLQEAYAVRDAMDIPGREKVYFQLLRSNLLYTVAEGIALTDTGLFYKLDGETGKLSWEGFITGAIACTDFVSGQQEGTLRIGTALTFPIDSDEDSRLARFLIDFHNRVYQKYTGSAAPSGWCMTQPRIAVAESASPLGSALGKITLGGVVASAAKALLQRSVTQRHIVQRPTLTRTMRTPVQQRRHIHPEPEPPQPPQPPRRPEPPQRNERRQAPQLHHQQRPTQPGGMFRQGGAPGRVGVPGGRGGMGGPGRGPGRGRR